MLEFHSVSNVSDKKIILSNLNAGEDSLLVADLRAKFEWQNFFLDKQQVIAEEFIFRPSDMWKKFANYILPEFQIVSNDYLLSYISSYLQAKTEDFLKTPSASQNLFAYLSQLGVILEHPEGRELMKEWFKENIDSFHRWGHWFFIAEEMWFHFKEKKIISSSWVPALLLGKEELLASFWKRPLYLDLSLEMKYVEAELFSELSHYLDVHVLFPKIKENSEFKLDFESYRPFSQKMSSGDSFEKFFDSRERELTVVDESWAEVCSVHRFSSALSEVKNVVSDLRELLDSGVSPSKIAVVSCDIGSYWPVLRPYLEKEGVPSQRPYNSGVQSLLQISQWLSDIKINSNKWQREDLELSMYREEEPQISYDDFLRFYGKIYDSSDLSRRKEVFSHYKKTLRNNELLERDDFVLWALSLWKSNNYPSVLEHLIKTIISESPTRVRLYLKDWIQYLGKLCSKQEVCIRPGEPSGILCVDISSLDYIDCEHVFVLGMSEGSFKKNSPLKAVSQQDMLSMRAQTGFPLSPEESRSFEYYLLWNLGQKNRKYYFSFAVTDFLGAIGAPSLVWLKERKKGKLKTDEIDSSKKSRIDILQLQPMESLPKNEDLLFSGLALLRDLGQEIVSPHVLERFSATGFRDFLQCPFKFAARYFFELRNVPSVDLDVDRMKNGSIIHRIFELALKKKIASKDSISITEIVRLALDDEIGELGEPELSGRYQLQYENILLRFLKFEEGWKINFPSTEHWKQEFELDVKWDFHNMKFTKQPIEGPRFRAIVDRIDKHENQACVIDYKNSGASYKNFSSWFEEDDFQLLFYTKILHDIFSPGDLEVFSGIYYSLKPWDRSKGFVRKDADPAYLPSTDRKRNKIEREQLVEAEIRLGELINEFYLNVEKGHLGPKPKDPQDLCGTCDWKGICRAKHLNS